MCLLPELHRQTLQTALKALIKEMDTGELAQDGQRLPRARRCSWGAQGCANCPLSVGQVEQQAALTAEGFSQTGHTQPC